EAAKRCFEKGMKTKQIVEFLGISSATASHWKRLYDKGTFYVNEKEKILFSLLPQNINKEDPLALKQLAKLLFDVSATDDEIAAALHLPLSRVSTWRDQYNQGSLNLHLSNDRSSTPLLLKDDSGFYTQAVRQAAKECFERGYGYKRTAAFLGLPVTAVKEWGRLYKNGKF
ncbi:MAG: helix-turn-helix domain-containing protein, partial [Burkholderiaceae bacterium]|nr:helix-turn-helix domain-containing protein [Burkholderiaceae bacterium]